MFNSIEHKYKTDAILFLYLTLVILRYCIISYRCLISSQSDVIKYIEYI